MKITNQIKPFFVYLIIIAFGFTSCEKVIEIDLNSSNPILVADGRMDLDSLAWIKLTYSRDYFNQEEAKYIEDAKVSIQHSKGEIEELQYQGNGVYQGIAMKGTANERYTLNIESKSNIYTAISELFGPTEIIDVSFEESMFSNPHDDKIEYAPVIKFLDDPSIKNYYMLKIWINDTLVNSTYTTIEDKYFNSNDTITYSPFGYRLDLNDQLIVRVYSIDKETERYYNQLNDNQDGGGMSGTPYNPKSNFGHEVMGYFTATSYDEYETQVIIEEKN